jgi:hypothetical protein
MPKPCPVCLGSGINISRGGYWQFSSGSASKCAGCGGKGWLDDSPAAQSATNIESELVLEVLKAHSALNIDDIVRLSGLSLPIVYQVLMLLKDRGLVGTRNASPVLYHAIKP